MKNKSSYKCKECGYETAKWLGKCPNCNAWNSFEEIVLASTISSQLNSNRLLQKAKSLPVQTLEDVLESHKNDKGKRYFGFKNEVLNNFWNQGLVAGSLTLLAGEPGLGKSTLALQILRSLYQENPNLKLLYITAEESVLEVARRAQRLDIPKQIMILQSNNFEQIEQNILEMTVYDLNTERMSTKTRPDLVIIDSIQTIFSADVASSPGSVSQVSFIANQFLSLSKSQNVAVVLIGHVTKEGQVAGPKTLEHLVDSVLFLEPSEVSTYRTLSFTKHRYGSTENQLLMQMKESGLEIITDPSLALLENLESGVGVCYGLAVDKNLPMVIEIQALVSRPNMGQGMFGRREAIGLKVSKLNTILAICEKYLDLELKNRDIYIQLLGMPKNLADDSLDLPILLAILSSLYQKSVEDLEFLKASKTLKTKQIFSGRLTLSGNLRAPTNSELREKTAKNLKFSFNSGIEFGELVKQIKVKS